MRQNILNCPNLKCLLLFMHLFLQWWDHRVKALQIIGRNVSSVKCCYRFLPFSSLINPWVCFVVVVVVVVLLRQDLSLCSPKARNIYQVCIQLTEFLLSLPLEHWYYRHVETHSANPWCFGFFFF